MDNVWSNKASDINRVLFSTVEAMKVVVTDKDSLHDAEKFGVVMEVRNDDLVATPKRTTEGEPVENQPRTANSVVIVPELLSPMYMEQMRTKKQKRDEEEKQH